MEKTIQITAQKALELYPTAAGTFKSLLEEEFGKDFLSQDITDKVKSFEDACAQLGISVSDVLSGSDTPDEAAYKKLKVIVRALNQGWTPDWTDGDQYKHYPWFDLSSGSGLAPYDFVHLYSSSFVGSRLCFKTRELAIYASKQFTSIYSDFMTL
jgi:hypothetical protein